MPPTPSLATLSSGNTMGRSSVLFRTAPFAPKHTRPHRNRASGTRAVGGGMFRAENRRGTERRILAERRLSKAADVLKGEVGQGVGSVTAVDAEETPPASQLSLVVNRGLPGLIRDVANACTGHGSARVRGECHSSRHGETIADDLKVWRGGKKIAQKAGVGFSCFAERARARARAHTYARDGAGILLIDKRKRRCCCRRRRPSRQSPDSVKLDRRPPVPS